MFEQATIAIRDEKGYTQLNARVDAAFSTQGIEDFLHRVTRSRLRIRDFEGVLKRGLLGKDAVAMYEALPASDQGLTRERYLRLVEKVPVELRQRYLKAYAYY